MKKFISFILVCLIAILAFSFTKVDASAATNNNLEIPMNTARFNEILKEAKSGKRNLEQTNKYYYGCGVNGSINIYAYKAQKSGYYDFFTSGNSDTVLKIFRYSAITNSYSIAKEIYENDYVDDTQLNNLSYNINASRKVYLVEDDYYFFCTRLYGTAYGTYSVCLKPHTEVLSGYSYAKWTSCNTHDMTKLGREAYYYNTYEASIFVDSLITEFMNLCAENIEKGYIDEDEVNELWSNILGLPIDIIQSFFTCSNPITGLASSLLVEGIKFIIDEIIREANSDKYDAIDNLRRLAIKIKSILNIGTIEYDGCTITAYNGLMLVIDYYADGVEKRIEAYPVEDGKFVAPCYEEGIWTVDDEWCYCDDLDLSYVMKNQFSFSSSDSRNIPYTASTLDLFQGSVLEFGYGYSGTISKKTYSVFHYRPLTSGYYDFYTTGTTDTVGSLVKRNGKNYSKCKLENGLTYVDDNNGCNTKFTQYLEAGTDYYFIVRAYSTCTGSFKAICKEHLDDAYSNVGGIWRNNNSSSNIKAIIYVTPSQAEVLNAIFNKNLFNAYMGLLLYGNDTTDSLSGTKIVEFVNAFYSSYDMVGEVLEFADPNQLGASLDFATNTKFGSHITYCADLCAIANSINALYQLRNSSNSTTLASEMKTGLTNACQLKFVSKETVIVNGVAKTTNKYNATYGAKIIIYNNGSLSFASWNSTHLYGVSGQAGAWDSVKIGGTTLKPTIYTARAIPSSTATKVTDRNNSIN